MILEISDLEISKTIPNIVPAAEGEPSLTDRLSAYLEDAELWLTQNIIPSDMIMSADESVLALCRGITVRRAVADAAAALDLLLTPNGFGVVSTDSIAPASKERTASLRSSLIDSIDSSISLLVCALRDIPEWTLSPQARLFGMTLVHDISDLSEVWRIKGQGLSLWLFYRSEIPRIQAAETFLADRFLSRQLMDHLREASFSKSLTDDERFVVDAVSEMTVGSLAGDNYDREKIISVVQYIRERPDAFPLWHSSSVAELFSPPTFDNDRSSSGYFF